MAVSFLFLDSVREAKSLESQYLIFFQGNSW
jgi:hypothetical protein